MADQLPTYQDVQRARQDAVCESKLADDSGFSVKMQKGISQEFNVSHGFDFAKANPLAGMVPGQPETTPSKYSFGGTCVGGIVNNEPSWVAMYDLSPFADWALGANLIKMSKSHKITWAFGHQKDQGGMHLIRELSFTKYLKKSNFTLTMAQPNLFRGGKINPEGVIQTSFNHEFNSKWRVGGDLTLRKQSQMGRTMTSCMPGLGIQYKHADREESMPGGKKYSDGKATITATAETNVMFAAQSLGIPTSLTLAHYARGGPIDSPNELYAELNIMQDPTPPQMGGTGDIKAVGCIAMCQKIKDPSAAVPPGPPGAPPPPTGSTIRTKLTTEGEVTCSIESQLHPLPCSVGVKMNYNIWKDKFKMGAGMNFGN